MGEQNHNLRLSRQKGWKGWVQSYKEVTTNGNWEKIKWDKKSKAKEVEKDGSTTIYRF
jgi:hypothetical protein